MSGSSNSSNKPKKENSKPSSLNNTEHIVNCNKEGSKFKKNSSIQEKEEENNSNFESSLTVFCSANNESSSDNRKSINISTSKINSSNSKNSNIIFTTNIENNNKEEHSNIKKSMNMRESNNMNSVEEIDSLCKRKGDEKQSNFEKVSSEDLEEQSSKNVKREVEKNKNGFNSKTTNSNKPDHNSKINENKINESEQYDISTTVPGMFYEDLPLLNSPPSPQLSELTNPSLSNGVSVRISELAHVGGVSKKRRIKMTPEQLRVLEHNFKLDCKPSASTKRSISELLKIPVKNVQIWFQNRRAKAKALNENMNPEIYQHYSLGYQRSPAIASSGVNSHSNIFSTSTPPSNALISHSPHSHSAGGGINGDAIITKNNTNNSSVGSAMRQKYGIIDDWQSSPNSNTPGSGSSAHKISFGTPSQSNNNNQGGIIGHDPNKFLHSNHQQQQHLHHSHTSSIPIHHPHSSNIQGQGGTTGLQHSSSHQDYYMSEHNFYDTNPPAFHNQPPTDHPMFMNDNNNFSNMYNFGTSGVQPDNCFGEINFDSINSHLENRNYGPGDKNNNCMNPAGAFTDFFPSPQPHHHSHHSHPTSSNNKPNSYQHFNRQPSSKHSFSHQQQSSGPNLSQQQQQGTTPSMYNTPKGSEDIIENNGEFVQNHHPSSLSFINGRNMQKSTLKGPSFSKGMSASGQERERKRGENEVIKRGHNDESRMKENLESLFEVNNYEENKNFTDHNNNNNELIEKDEEENELNNHQF